MWWLPGPGWRNDGWRWRVAALADKLPGQCWADLVSWALRHHEDDHDTPFWDAVRRVPLRRQTDSCRSDFARNGVCYCARLRTPEVEAAMKAAPTRERAR